MTNRNRRSSARCRLQGSLHATMKKRGRPQKKVHQGKPRGRRSGTKGPSNPAETKAPIPPITSLPVRCLCVCFDANSQLHDSKAIPSRLNSCIQFKRMLHVVQTCPSVCVCDTGPDLWFGYDPRWLPCYAGTRVYYAGPSTLGQRTLLGRSASRQESALRI